MASFLTGVDWGTTEQVTNTKLKNMVNNASISNILASEFNSNLLTSLTSNSGKIPPQNMWLLGTPATNASLIDISTFTSINLYYSTYGSIGTFINARNGQPFTLFTNQASFPVIKDGGSFLLSADWIPASVGDNLTLVWNGTSFIEVSRVTV